MSYKKQLNEVEVEFTLWPSQTFTSKWLPKLNDGLEPYHLSGTEVSATKNGKESPTNGWCSNPTTTAAAAVKMVHSYICLVVQI